MVFDWTSYLEVSEFLVKNLRTEASYRSCISRAYYCAFGRARVFCLNKRLIKHHEKGGSDIHRILVERLTLEEDDLDIYRIGQILGGLRETRNKADYDAHCKEPMNEHAALDAVEDAHELIRLLDDYP